MIRKKTEVFRLRLERPLLIELYDAVEREQDKREPRYESVASLVRFALRRWLKGKR